MEITELSNIILPDGVVRFQYITPSANFLYLGYILESLEGLCLYTNPPENKGIMQVDVVPDLLNNFQEIITAIRKLSF
ncbi:MAG: DUF4911 domain-containing protein [Candidatus Cloacimonetes bacterium]|nr:DUF4911 domain-containing protein [Candidatus Cloacimonadota bacterium]